ncbi:MAG: MFS transporter [Anaerolineae bacterium]|nr:MFS transporter [Anaerolineae bacterium]NUQ03541.1 MFS transporter [Anaerolineae bacterium]
MVLPRSRLFWSVSIGHLVIDIFNASVAVQLTFISGHILSLTNTQIGLAISLYQLVSALSQPFAGWLADRTGGRSLGAGGVALTVGMQALALLLAATTHNYTLMVVPLVLAAVGNGTYHPVGTMHASSNPATRSSDLSIFFMMGQLGGGLGPAITGMLLDRFSSANAVFTQALGGFEARLVEHGSIAPILVMALFALPSILYMLVSMPNRDLFRQQNGAVAKGTMRRPLGLTPLLMLGAMVAMRGLVNPGMVAFLPRLFQSRGWSPAEYGLVTSSFWFAGAFVGLIAGQLAVRFGDRLVIGVTLLISAPAVFLLGSAADASAYLLAIVAGAFSSASHPLIVAMTQRLLPGGRGLASGVGLGAIFGMGALGTLVIGALSDSVGIETAFRIIAVVTVFNGLLALRLPGIAPTEPPPAVPDESREVVPKAA